MDVLSEIGVDGKFRYSFNALKVYNQDIKSQLYAVSCYYSFQAPLASASFQLMLASISM
jgi:hypothetical protein